MLRIYVTNIITHLIIALASHEESFCITSLINIAYANIHCYAIRCYADGEATAATLVGDATLYYYRRYAIAIAPYIATIVADELRTSTRLLSRHINIYYATLLRHYVYY